MRKTLIFSFLFFFDSDRSQTSPSSFFVILMKAKLLYPLLRFLFHLSTFWYWLIVGLQFYCCPASNLVSEPHIDPLLLPSEDVRSVSGHTTIHKIIHRETLLNLQISTLREYEWYKQYFLSRISFLDDFNSTIWKDKLIA